MQNDTQLNATGNNKQLQRLSVAGVYEALGTSDQGLSLEEVQKRLNEHGKNILREEKGQPLIVKLLANFTHLMAILLWAGGVVGFIAKMPELGIAIWLVNVINGLFSFFQEFRAEKATAALKQLLPTYARVVRDGEEKRIPAEDLVPGDIILLCEGDRISADARLVQDSDLRVDQSTLTGESHPVHKARNEIYRDDLTRAEFSNMVFAGTNVAAGTGMAVIYATGMNTEFGKIAGLTQSLKNEESPLQKEMRRITKVVSAMAVSIGIVFFIAAVALAGTDLAESFIFAMGMIVAFVPEGLLPTVTLSLAMGVQRMAKRGALIKRLSAVETLGCTTVICTDKTGTLTQNQMTVSDVWMPRRGYQVTGTGYAAEGSIVAEGSKDASVDADLASLLTGAGLCNNARLIPPNGESPRWTVLGDPTEAALLVLAQKGGIDPAEQASLAPHIRELPFDSSRKRMCTIHQPQGASFDNGTIVYVKGAPKEVLDLCASYVKDGKELEMDEALRDSAMRANDRYAHKGLRVLAVARRRLTKGSALPSSLSAYTAELVEKELTFLGLVAMADPPRPEVAEAVVKCHHAGIRIIMITGDYGLTALSIAHRIGIIKTDGARVINGVELEKMSEQELKEALSGEVVFARVAPEQKLQVVSVLQSMGHVVAVTGDGVNDSPALKKADIGVAMGMTGTDVAKEAADMILTDDNFASIVNAVEEGRTVYNNIRKFIVYIFNSNVPEALPFILYLFSRGAIPLPLTIMQVLSIDLGTDMVPAIALGADLPEKGIMDNPPRSQKAPLLNGSVMKRAFLWYGLIEAVIGMIGFALLYHLHGQFHLPLQGTGEIYRMATTMTLAAIVFSQIGVVFACRTTRLPAVHRGMFNNKIILVGIAVEISLLSILMYFPPLHELFNTAPLELREWAILAVIPFVVLLLDETRKALQRSRRNIRACGEKL
ncbi:MAG: cation-transporting P-type ATPase [Bacillota bacterium]